MMDTVYRSDGSEIQKSDYGENGAFITMAMCLSESAAKRMVKLLNLAQTIAPCKGRYNDQGSFRDEFVCSLYEGHGGQHSSSFSTRATIEW